MRFKTRLILPGIMTLVLMFSGCKKSSTDSTPSGNIYGFVTLYDQYGGIILNSLNTTSVTLNGKTTTTNAAGEYTFDNLNAGEFTVSASNPGGFGGINGATFQFTGGGNLDHDIKLSQIPNFTDTLLSDTSDMVTYVTINGFFNTTDLHRRTAVLFVGNTSAVTSTPSSYLREYTVLANTNNYQAFSFKIALSDLTDAGFTAGSTVYFAAYGGATEFASSSEWEDIMTTGRNYYTALSPTFATISFVMP